MVFEVKLRMDDLEAMIWDGACGGIDGDEEA